MSKSLSRLISTLTTLPGIGEKSAQRIARHLLKLDPEEVEELSRILIQAHRRIRACRVCGNLTEEEFCSICRNPSRKQTEICVVEEPFDIATIERAGIYDGLYHVLGGALSPLDDVTPDRLRIKELLERIEEGGVEEIILATSATSEGEATAIYLATQLRGRGVKVTRIARGIPVGTDLGLADEVTITKALQGRKHLEAED